MYQRAEHYLDSDASSQPEVMAHARLLQKLAPLRSQPRRRAAARGCQLSRGTSLSTPITAQSPPNSPDEPAFVRRVISGRGLECSLIEVKVQPRQNPYQTMDFNPKALLGLSGASQATSENTRQGPGLRQGAGAPCCNASQNGMMARRSMNISAKMSRRRR